ncbi:MAG: FecR domain-containing protein [Fibrobacterota bacterium]
MRSFRLPGPVGMIIPLSFILISAVHHDNKEFFEHTVRKGESVSLICIDHYGQYTREMGAAIKESNPAISDINIIHIGQKLKLKNPDYNTASKTEQSSGEHPLFQKNVKVTQGVVTYVEGTASIIPRGQNSKQTLKTNTIVKPGDLLETASNGRVELIINRESVVRMRENTQMNIEAFRNNAKNSKKTSLGFSFGTVWTKMRKFTDKVSRFQLELPNAVAGVHGTVYQTVVDPGNGSEVKVYEGEVAVSGNQKADNSDEAGNHPAGVQEVTGPDEIPGPHEVSMEEWVHIVTSMQKIRIGEDGIPGKPQSFTKEANDSWEKWNEERDKRIAEIFGEI